MTPQAADAPERYRRTSKWGEYGRFWDDHQWPCQQPPWGTLNAVDVNTGAIAWKVPLGMVDEIKMKTGTPNLGGSIVSGGLVFIGATNDARFRAFDSKTGKEVWATKVEENKNGYYITMAPLVADGKVFVGASGGERGIRGFIAAFDPGTGEELWRTFTVPAPGDPGSETWPKGDQWKNGGGSVWVTPNYDPETNLLFVGTGNGGPWIGDKRPGDNLYTASTIAVDATTGQVNRLTADQILDPLGVIDVDTKTGQVLPLTDEQLQSIRGACG